MHRDSSLWPALPTLLAVLFALTLGCVADFPQPSHSAPALSGVLAQFPAPSVVLRQSRATEAERTKLGAQYLDDVGLSNRMQRLDPEQQAWFGPDFEPPLYPPLSGLAYCVYRFHLPSYNDTSDVVYYFSTPPDAWGDAYIGLGDLSRDVWRWRQCTFSGKFSYASLAPYISAPGEELLLAVAVIGNYPAVLDYVRIGDNPAPVAEFTAEPSTGPAPLSVYFDGSLSYDYQGAIVNYEWDLAGDGVYELSGPTLSTAGCVYDTPGTYHAALRVSDACGALGTATVPVTVNGEPSGTWHITMADGGNEETGWHANLLEVQGFPAVAYLDHKNSSTNGVVRYVRALDAQGSAWGAPVLIGECGGGGGHVSLALVEGKPAVAYGDAVNRQFVYCAASNVNGDAWPLPLKIADDYGDYPGFTALAVVDGNPAVAFADTSAIVRYVRALDASGATWPAAPVTLDSAANAIDGAQLLLAGGVPQLYYVSDMWRNVRLVRAQDAQGSAWDAPQTLVSTGMGLYAAAALVEGNPALAYIDGDTLELYYMRADDALGTSWGAALQLTSVPSSGRTYPSLALIAGNPAVTYYDQDNGKLLYIRAQDSLGLAWGAPQVVDNHWFDTTGWYSCLNQVAGIPEVAYYNFTQGALMFAALY